MIRALCAEVPGGLPPLVVVVEPRREFYSEHHLVGGGDAAVALAAEEKRVWVLRVPPKRRELVGAVAYLQFRV